MTVSHLKKEIPTILVVEDDNLILDLMLQKLKQEDFKLLVAKESEIPMWVSELHNHCTSSRSNHRGVYLFR